MKNKKGQFFIIMSVIIIGLVAGLATITNSVIKQSDVKFYHVGDELKSESEKAIDYGIGQNYDTNGMKSLLTNFSNNYSSYSNADNFYYIFGTTTEITFAGLKKKSNDEISFQGATPSSVSLIAGEFKTQALTPSGTTSINMTIDGTKYPFTLQEGQNFFFVVSKEIEGNIYTATNG